MYELVVLADSSGRVFVHKAAAATVVVEQAGLRTCGRVAAPEKHTGTPAMPGAILLGAVVLTARMQSRPDVRLARRRGSAHCELTVQHGPLRGASTPSERKLRQSSAHLA